MTGPTIGNMVRFALALLLAACAAPLEPVADGCQPPTFTEPACFSPGGGVTRCPVGDGSYWDRRAAGGVVTHWRCANHASACESADLVIICER